MNLNQVIIALDEMTEIPAVSITHPSCNKGALGLTKEFLAVYPPMFLAFERVNKFWGRSSITIIELGGSVSFECGLEAEGKVVALGRRWMVMPIPLLESCLKDVERFSNSFIVKGVML